MVPSRTTTPGPRPTAEFARQVRVPMTEAGRLQRGVELVVALVRDCDHAGVTVLTPAFVETVAASDDVVLRGDGWQHELSEGPGLECVRSRSAVVSQDLQTDVRWRSWAPRAVRRLGVRSTVSVLLDPHGETVGSLTLYSDRADVWDDDQRALARTLVRQLALAAADARRHDDRRRALASRAGLGQAQRIVMERLGMSEEQASDHLRRLSRRTRMTLVHLAEHIVVTRELPVLHGEERPA